jgi:hypothetical protein
VGVLTNFLVEIRIYIAIQTIKQMWNERKGVKYKEMAFCTMKLPINSHPLDVTSARLPLFFARIKNSSTAAVHHTGKQPVN